MTQSSPKPKRTTPKVLLIGWDAADWQLIDPLIERGWMPNLKRLIDEGVRGNLATLQPVLSPILWNSIATGKRADKHDILGFMEPDGQGGIRPVTSTSRKAKALWNILSQNGLRSCVVNWFASYPAERINGCTVSDRYRHCHGERLKKSPIDDRVIYPGSLIGPLSELVVGPNDVTAEQILPFIPCATEIDHTKDPRLGAFATSMAECASIHNAATWIAENEEWDLLAVYYETIDHIGHGFMEYHPPKMAHVSDADFEMYSNVMSRVVEYHDMMLGRLLQLAGEDTITIILSDHGFLNNELRPPIFWNPEKTGPGMNPVAWHRQQGMIVAHGPGIRKGATVTGASLLDIAPTVLVALRQPIGEDMDGAPLLQVFEGPPTVERIGSYEPPHESDGVWRTEVEEDPWSAQEALKQLVALGYVEDPGEDKNKGVKRCTFDRRSNLAQVYFASQRTQKAVEILKELVEEQPEHTQVRARLALAYVTLKRFDEAEEHLSAIKGESDELMPVVSLLRGQVLLNSGRIDEARELFEMVLRTRSRLPIAHLQVGSAYLLGQHWKEAEQAYRRALEIDPDNVEAHDRLGIALRGQGNLEDAVFHHMKAVTLNHHQPVAHINLGIALGKLGQVDWAIRAFETASEQLPASPFPHTCLAKLYGEGKGDTERADYHRRMAMDLRKQRDAGMLEEAFERGAW